jgi:ATP-dependent exoDNAse (exonuclease V) beta subunit
VWQRPDNDPSTPMTVCPGEHVFAGEDGPYPIVWWDPHALGLGVESSLGIRRESLIVKDVPPAIVADGLREYGEWRDAREIAIARGSTPSLTLRTATEWAASGQPSDFSLLPSSLRDAEQPGLFDEPAPEAEPAPAASPFECQTLDLRARGDDRSARGTRFGDLVHALLAAVPLDAERSAIDALADVHGRILAATAEEVAGASAVVERVLRHDLLVRARAAASRGTCRRETPVTCTLAHGGMIEGVVDLAFEADGEWTVVDYKTDREIAAEGEEQYQRQVALYAYAISQATGAPARAILARV